VFIKGGQAGLPKGRGRMSTVGIQLMTECQSEKLIEEAAVYA